MQSANKLKAETTAEGVKQILFEQIELAKPADLAFLESQVPYIAGRIVHYLDSQAFEDGYAQGRQSVIEEVNALMGCATKRTFGGVR